MKRVILAIAATVALSACGSLQTTVESQSTADALMIATLYAIEQSADREAEARKIIREAENAKAELANASDAVTADRLIAEARARIAQSDGDLSKKAALNLLLDRLDDRIRALIRGGAIDPAALVTINKLLDVVINAATAYAR